MKLLLALIISLGTFTCFAQSDKYLIITPQQLQEKKDDVFTDVPAKIIYRNIYLEIGKFLEVREARKIYTNDGLEYSDFEIPFDNVDVKKAITYNWENGKTIMTEVGGEGIFTEEVSKGFEINKIAFPNVKEGSVIEIVYRVNEIGLWTVNYQDIIPIKQFWLEIKNPFYYTGFNITKNGFAKVDLEDSQTDDVLVYKGVNIPGLKFENYLGSTSNYFGRMFFEPVYYADRVRGQSWGSVANYYHTKEINKKAYFKKDLENVVGGELDPMKKAKLIYSYVKDRMKWNDYYGISDYNLKKIYRNEEGTSGEINLILVAMLKEAGLDAYIMKVASKRKGLVHFPSYNIFNNTICALEIDKQYHLLDASQPHGSFGEIPLPFVNGDGLLIVAEGNCRLVSTQARSKSQNTVIINAEIDTENLLVKGNVKKRISGYYAWEHREEYEKIDIKNYTDDLEELNNSLRISNFENQNFYKSEQPVSMFYDFEMEDYFEKIGEDIYFDPLLYFGKEENDFIDDERVFPIDFGFPFSKKVMVTFQLPEGYQVKSIPKGKTLAIPDAIGSLSFKCISTNNGVQVTFNLDINKGMIETAYYPSIQQLFSEYVSVSKSKIVLTKN